MMNYLSGLQKVEVLRTFCKNYSQGKAPERKTVAKGILARYKQWKITNIFTTTVNNATANDVAIAYLKKMSRSYKTLMFGGEFLHCRCVCRIHNLIVKNGIEKLE